MSFTLNPTASLEVVLRKPNFSPISGAPSSLIWVASGYLTFSGILVAALTVISIFLFPQENRHVGMPLLVVGVALNLVAAGGMFWAGKMIGRQSRRGGYLALAFVLLSLLSPLTGVSIAFGILSLIVLATIWKDLR